MFDLWSVVRAVWCVVRCEVQFVVCGAGCVRAVGRMGLT